MEEILAPLNKEKAQVMRSLLESVQTTKLKSAFDKYLPAVLNTGSEKKAKAPLTESISVVDGNKSAKKVAEIENEDKSNVIDLKRLAGLN